MTTVLILGTTVPKLGTTVPKLDTEEEMKMSDVSKLDSFEKEELLRWFLHWMPMEKRGEFMAKYPQSYNKVYGEKIVKVVRCEEVVRKGCTTIANGKTYKEGDVVPESEVKCG